eukprot:scaffold13.g213.t1
MGGGGAISGDQMEAPRLTSWLRANSHLYASTSGRGASSSGAGSSGGDGGAAGLMDLHRLIQQRDRQLQERLRQRADMQASAARAALVRATLGSWEGAPKAAREDFERYVRGVAQQLLGGEASSSEEVAASAQLAWQALRGLPPPDTSRGRSLLVALAPARAALEQAFGVRVGDDALLQLHRLHGDLARWSAASGSGRPGAAKAGGQAAGAGAPAFRPAAEALAAEAVPMSTEEAVVAMCGISDDVAQQVLSGGGRAVRTAAGAAGSAAAGAQGQGGGSGARVVSEREAAATEAEVFGGKAQLVNKEAGARWLMQWCARATGGAGDEGLATAVCGLLLSGRGDDELAAEMFDLVGAGGFEHIGELLQLRASVAANVRAVVAGLREAEAAEAGPAMPSYGPTVSVMSESQKLISKMERKAQRRSAKASGGGGGGGGAGASGDPDLEWLTLHGLGAVAEEELERETAHMRIRLGDGMEFRIGEGTDGQARNALPKGTTRKSFKGYEEVRVPAVAPSVAPPGEAVVQVAALPDWAQLAFQGYERLNRIQSRIFPTAFNSNENLLVCAPTGAGKTNIAMIAVLREVMRVGANMRHGVIQKADFKIVYVAPMKALAAEVTANFGKRLEALGLSVRELTGDMQLSKKEMAETQMIVTTPEKWDVITRKGGEVSVAAMVRLLIIGERMHVESSQSMIRVVGLSATLPNYRDVARFLGVNADTGLYYFDASYRPVPLEMQARRLGALPLWPRADTRPFVGVSERNVMARNGIMDEVCYQKARRDCFQIERKTAPFAALKAGNLVVDSLRRGFQAMVFVHSRKDTGRTARALALKAQQAGETALFDCSEEQAFPFLQRDVRKSRNREVAELFESGLGIHHAGMLRTDRNLMERCFGQGLIKARGRSVCAACGHVLCCTATLAWGVNLPAHTVIIRGTQLYNPQKGGFTDLGMLDVQQIFGRAGRPQYQDTGEDPLVLKRWRLLLAAVDLPGAADTQRPLPRRSQVPIESQFTRGLVDHLNAEIVLGTVTNVREASQWLSYTYLYTRMTQNPLSYGIGWEELSADPRLDGHRRKLITEAARQLEASKMARFDERSGNLYVTELGRVASHFYIRHDSINVFNEMLKPHMSEADVLAMIARSSEFENLAMRDEELPELDTLARDACYYESYISRARVESFSLTADLMYVSQARAGAPQAATQGEAFELRLWPEQHPLRQFEGQLSLELLRKLEDRDLTLDRLADMEPQEIGAVLRHPAAGPLVAGCVESFPYLTLDCQLHPITRTVLRIQLTLTPAFKWRDSVQGMALRWLVWVEDSDNEHIYHSEPWILTKKMAREGEQRLAFTVPIFEPLPSQYYIRVVSDSWLGAEATLPVSFKSLILPERHPPHTELLDLEPLPVTALANPTYQSLYSFSHFNPIQTQARALQSCAERGSSVPRKEPHAFHKLYHTDASVLLGAPTGSGKTISAELCMLRCFAAHPGQKVVYIAPLKALVRERISDWGSGFCKTLGKSLVELTGDFTPDLRALLAADVIIATPEKWDGISRNWQSRGYVRKVGLLVIDEIHLLGADRGPILEVIVSRMRYVAAQTERPIRFVGLSTALANARDLADWLGVGPQGLFNFKPSVRPVPLECHIQGYPGKFYCPRMATMNKPAYAAIQTHSPTKPVLVFVSSRRQTRLTALDLIAYAAADERPRAFLRMGEGELEQCLGMVKDASLRHTLQFGIGLHHAGLADGDRTLVEKLYVGGKIQVLVATSTLAWGVNTPAHLVIIKGTEFYDAPTKRYVDYPITDVLQMMGRAGRPQYDRRGVAVIMVHEPKKSFYKKFLYEPFPVESSLPGQLPDHLNAEVVGGTIRSRQDAIDYLTWTFFIRRLLQNPSYYDLDSTDQEAVSAFLSGLVKDTLLQLQDAGCLEMEEETGAVVPLTMGRIASYYYMRHQARRRASGLLWVLCSAAEYDELPVRHNEDRLNTVLAGQVRWPVDTRTADDPHTKANLLLQAHMGRLPLPISDYALVDISSDAGWLDTALAAMALVQSLMQGRWYDDHSVLMLPHVTDAAAAELEVAGLAHLIEALRGPADDGGGGGGKRRGKGGGGRAAAMRILERAVGERAARDVAAVCERLPLVSVGWTEPRLRQPAAAAQQQQGDGVGEVPEQQQPEQTQAEQQQEQPGPSTYAMEIKEEGWWLLVGSVASGELLAVKRVSFGQRLTTRLSFPAHAGSGEPLGEVQLLLVCDSYQGLDQQYTVALGGAGGAPPVAPVGQAARRARRAAQAEERRARGAGEGQVDGGAALQQHELEEQRQGKPGGAAGPSAEGGGAASSGAGESALPQRQPRGRRAGRAAQPSAQGGTLSCGRGEEGDEGEQLWDG